MQKCSDEWYTKAMSQLVKKDAHVKNGSGWIVEVIEKVKVTIATHQHLSPRKGHRDIELPKALTAKQAVINSKECQMGSVSHSVLAAIYRDLISQKQRIAKKYKCFINKLNFEKISEPKNTKEDIDTFERQNIKCAISVFQWEDKEDKKKKLPVTLIRSLIGKKTSSKSTIMLLLVKGDDSRHHYIPITNLDRLLNSKDKLHNCIWCERCLRPFYSQWRKAYEKHRKICYTTNRH